MILFLDQSYILFLSYLADELDVDGIICEYDLFVPFLLSSEIQVFSSVEKSVICSPSTIPFYSYLSFVVERGQDTSSYVSLFSTCPSLLNISLSMEALPLSSLWHDNMFSTERKVFSSISSSHKIKKDIVFYQKVPQISEQTSFLPNVLHLSAVLQIQKELIVEVAA